MANKTVTVKPSGGTYTSLAAAIAGELSANANLVTMDGILTISIEGNWSGSPDTTFVDLNGFTMDATRYLVITSDAANYYTGKWDTTKYILRVANYYGTIHIQDDYVTLLGLQLEQTINNDSGPGILIDNIAAANKIRFGRLGIKMVDDSARIHKGIHCTDADAIFEIWNSVVWMRGSSWNGSSHAMDLTAASVKAENCTVFGGCRGYMNRGNNVWKGINLLAIGTASDCFYDYTWAAGTTNCAGDDTTAPGANQHDSVSVAFVDAANGDFHLAAADTDVIDHGTSGVSLGFTDDVDGVTRSGTWDIGADEYVAGGGGTTYEQAVGGTLSFSGGATKSTQKALAGALGFSGALSRLTSKPLSGPLSFSGSLAKQSAKALAGSLAFSGSATKITAKALAGTLTFSGAAAKLVQKVLAGALSFAGTLSSATLHMYYQAVGGVLAFSGGVQKVTQKSLGGVLAFGGGVAKLVTRALAGTISFTGNAAKLTQRSLSGAISFVGSLVASTGSAVMDGIMKVVVSAKTAVSRVTSRAPGASVGGRSPRADVSGRS